MRAGLTLVEQNRVAVVVRNVNVSILCAISVVSPTPCLLNHRSDARFCVEIVSAPAARRIAALERVSGSTLAGLFFFHKTQPDFPVLRASSYAVACLRPGRNNHGLYSQQFGKIFAVDGVDLARVADAFD